jgi:UMF1 family MFS transporter
MVSGRAGSWLECLGLHRADLRAWALYDWAVSGWQTTILTALFPVYYYSVAGAGLPPGSATGRFAAATALSVFLIALASPFLGAVADRTSARKRFLGSFLGLGVVSTAGMAWIGRGDLGLATALFVASYIGASGSLVFYDALLPHIVRGREIDRVSTVGHALGYLGGGILLALVLALISGARTLGSSGPDSTVPVRLALLTVAAWWLIFAIPLFKSVAEPRRSDRLREGAFGRPLRGGFGQFKGSVRHLLRSKQAAVMLLAFLIYQAGIETIIKMAAIFGKEMGINDRALIATILLVQFIGIPCAVLFGWLADRIGAKHAILIALCAYSLASVLGYFMTGLRQFVLIALLVGMVRGGCQALSRSLFARLIPAHDSATFFGFFSVSEKLAGALGPGLFALVIAMTGSSRPAVGALVLFFLIGGALLSRVEVGETRRTLSGAQSSESSRGRAALHCSVARG